MFVNVLNVTDYFFSSVHFARGNLNLVSALLITKPFEFRAKLQACFAPHKPTDTPFGNPSRCDSGITHHTMATK